QHPRYESSIPGSQQTKLYLDFDLSRHRLAIPTHSRPEAPILHRFNRFLFETESRPTYNFDTTGAPVRCNYDLQNNQSLELWLPRRLGIFCVRAIYAFGKAHAIVSRSECVTTHSAIPS